MLRLTLASLCTLLVAQLAAAAPGSSPQAAAEARLAAIEKRVGGRLGVVALEPGSGRRIERRPQERFPMCSTFKVLAVAAALHRVDEKQDELGRFIPYSEAELLEYAPVTRAHVQEGGLTLSALCAAAITLSDNTAANLILKTIEGPEGFTRYARSLGDKQTRLDRVEPELNSAIPGDPRDTTTPAAMINDLRKLLLGDALSPSSRRQLEEWMRQNQTGGELIRAGVPHDWQVGDKTGRGADGATNDIAILWPPSGKPILLAIYTVGSKAPAKERLQAVADAARVVAESF